MLIKSLLQSRLLVHDASSVALVDDAITRAENKGLQAPGIDDPAARRALCMQIIESIRRVQFVINLKHRKISALRADPNTTIFDPLRAACVHMAAGNIDEAAWLVFLSTHFGHRPVTKWNLVKCFYRGDTEGPWTWKRSISEKKILLDWLAQNKDVLRASGRFGNHRKYESLDAFGSKGTGAAISTYMDWVTTHGNHENLFSRANQEGAAIPEAAFAWLYDEMNSVARFARMGKFDFLCMLGKLDIAYIAPGSMFVAQATGPLKGSKVLFGSNKSASEIEGLVSLLNNEMEVGMQVFEDAICNWQKSTHCFVAFRG
ncbi:hypothetical protein [Xanthomonas hortorum]|uniref:Alpha-glutamyl/putrescinyl thymine pyrophosphorylase clade 3 domain-containing protein n=4 Tax=Xanthomonas hortorum TaxID=56454 RepID=A0A6V7F8F1_9XANT|nr:hypothetical protein [Xanthomonas hortorum]MCE4354988.1 hypothetical protein [Xanthomonas hortorum pv. pelargonii]MCM5535179.1 hypothetical protein [Xanthomonas hortorum pv. pelargonii]MCM5539308.1 hypothetical protein [Xanthomonas hortorum pv. pelargonii]MCM5547069.1 hypothetical protein [Xanthomonas hortorum pv. pelargonii]MCM5565050.1 hypothetical protein [Xanthomonas hortorum pv. pelargonii]